MQRQSRPKDPGAKKPGVVSPRQADLEQMRDRLLAAMDQVDAKDLPRVCSELRAVDAELAQLAPATNPDQELVDELKAKRARRSTATG